MVSELDALLEMQFLPSLTGRSGFSADELSLLKLPARLGGIGLPSFTTMADTELAAAKAMTQAQVVEIQEQNNPHEVPPFQKVHRSAVLAKKAHAKQRKKSESEVLSSLLTESSLDNREVKLLLANAVSAWLTVLPLKEHGFWLSKRDF